VLQARHAFSDNPQFRIASRRGNGMMTLQREKTPEIDFGNRSTFFLDARIQADGCWPDESAHCVAPSDPPRRCDPAPWKCRNRKRAEPNANEYPQHSHAITQPSKAFRGLGANPGTVFVICIDDLFAAMTWVDRLPP